MLIITLGNRGYLGENKGTEPQVVTSTKEARPFGTKKQAQRAITRIEKKNPNFDLTSISIVPAGKVA